MNICREPEMANGEGFDAVIDPHMDPPPNRAEAEDCALQIVRRQEQVRTEAQIFAFLGVLVQASDVPLLAISENDLARQWVQPKIHDLGSVLVRLQDDAVDRYGFYTEQIVLEAAFHAIGARPYPNVERPVPASYLDDKQSGAHRLDVRVLFQMGKCLSSDA